MPYDNVPESQWADMDKCVEQVMGEGKDKAAAIAICHASIVKGEPLAPVVLDMPTVKAGKEWELEVLGVPFGGPNNGKDSDGETFTAETNIYRENFTSVPVFYYHGYTPDGQPQGDPVVIGKAEYDRTDSRGHWYKVTLDKASQYAARVWQAAKDGMARASSGAIGHLVRKLASGVITHWPLAELSVFDTGGKRQPANGYAVALPVLKAHYETAQLTLHSGVIEMNENEKAQKADYRVEGVLSMEAIEAAVEEAMQRRDEAQAEEAKRKAANDAAIAEAVKAEREKMQAEFAKANRLPQAAPYQAKYGETWKYDNFTPGDLAVTAEMLAQKGKQASPILLKSLALKMENATGADAGPMKDALKAANIKADETDYTTNTNYGAEWIGTAWSTEVWRQIRQDAMVAGKVPVGPDIPQGNSNVYIPLESTDPVWYKVPEATDSTYNSTTLVHNGTYTPSPMGTANKQITVGKAGARAIYTGELEEDSIVPFAAQLRAQLAASGAEVLDYVFINGDTDLTASTNINAIDTTPAATTLFSLTNGFRKLALVTNTANSRSAGGSLDITDFLETVKLMGAAGMNALDITKVGILLDVNTYYKALGLPEVLTRDVNGQATVENGRLTRVFGYEVMPSAFVHGMNGYGSAKRMANSAGKIDADTDANNLYGAIIAVRWDQWQARYKRRMTMEMVRRAESDTNEVIAHMRFGLGYRDTEASAITYYVGV